MATYVADTHALVWYLSKHPALSSRAQAVFYGAATGVNQIVVPTIVIAELMRMVEKRRTALNVQQVVTALEKANGYQFAPLTIPIVLQIQATASLPDLHDRFITATALTFGATLITQDQIITQSGLIPVIW